MNWEQPGAAITPSTLQQLAAECPPLPKPWKWDLHLMKVWQTLDSNAHEYAVVLAIYRPRWCPLLAKVYSSGRLRLRGSREHPPTPLKQMFDSGEVRRAVLESAAGMRRTLLDDLVLVAMEKGSTDLR